MNYFFKVVGQFTYLSSYTASNRLTAKEVDARIRNAPATCAVLSYLWQRDNVSAAGRGEACSAAVKPIILYRSEMGLAH